MVPSSNENLKAEANMLSLRDGSTEEKPATDAWTLLTRSVNTLYHEEVNKGDREGYDAEPDLKGRRSSDAMDSVAGEDVNGSQRFEQSDDEVDSVMSPGSSQDVNMEPSNVQRFQAPSTFVVKLRELLDSPAFSSAIGWTSDGTGVVIKNMQTFQELVLNKVFKAGNFSSFVRQLNMYGFHKSAKHNVGKKQPIVFQHPAFQRDKLHLMKTIKRKRPKSKSSSFSSLGRSLSISQSESYDAFQALPEDHPYPSIEFTGPDMLPVHLQVRGFPPGAPPGFDPRARRYSSVGEYCSIPNCGCRGFQHPPMSPMSPHVSMTQLAGPSGSGGYLNSTGSYNSFQQPFGNNSLRRPISRQGSNFSNVSIDASSTDRSTDRSTLSAASGSTSSFDSQRSQNSQNSDTNSHTVVDTHGRVHRIWRCF
eukprot:Colp12_sorted_trinity150504_noHs@30671